MIIYDIFNAENEHKQILMSCNGKNYTLQVFKLRGKRSTKVNNVPVDTVCVCVRVCQREPSWMVGGSTAV